MQTYTEARQAEARRSRVEAHNARCEAASARAAAQMHWWMDMTRTMQTAEARAECEDQAEAARSDARAWRAMKNPV
jgi:hypothetical protein